MPIRDATSADLPAIFEIYNREVLESAATFETEPVGESAQRAWFEDHARHRLPLIVAMSGSGAVTGWAGLSRWSGRCAYARAAEVSVYVHRDHQGNGVGRTLLSALIDRARQRGLGVLLARIESTGAASLRLHESAGFRTIGVMRRVGEKFGAIRDVVLMDLHLDEAVVRR